MIHWGCNIKGGLVGRRYFFLMRTKIIFVYILVSINDVSNNFLEIVRVYFFK